MIKLVNVRLLYPKRETFCIFCIYVNKMLVGESVSALVIFFIPSQQSPHLWLEAVMGTVRRDIQSSTACAKPGGQLTQHLPGCVCARWTMPLSPATECSLRAPTPELRPWNSYRHSWSWRARSLSLFPLANSDNKSCEEKSAVSANIFSRSHSSNMEHATWAKL